MASNPPPPHQPTVMQSTKILRFLKTSGFLKTLTLPFSATGLVAEERGGIRIGTKDHSPKNSKIQN